MFEIRWSVRETNVYENRARVLPYAQVSVLHAKLIVNVRAE